MKRALLALLILLGPLSANATSIPVITYPFTVNGHASFQIDFNSLTEVVFYTTPTSPDASTGFQGGGERVFNLQSIASSTYLVGNLSTDADADIPVGIYTFKVCYNNFGTGCDADHPQEVDVYNYTGSAVVPENDQDSTRILSVIPAYGTTAATSTPVDLNAIGVINNADIPRNADGSAAFGTTTGLTLHWSYHSLANNCFAVICAAESSADFDFRIPIFLNDATTSSQSFNIDGVGGAPKVAGTYVMTTSIEKPSSFLGFTNFFGIGFGFSTVVSTTTQFIAGTTTTLTNVLGGIRAQNFTATTTEAATNACLPIPGTWDMYNCVQALFVPTTRPDYGGDFAALSNKPPFGYFTSVNRLLSEASTTATTTPSGFAFVAATLGRLILGLSFVLWFLFLVFVFNRVRLWDFQH